MEIFGSLTFSACDVMLVNALVIILSLIPQNPLPLIFSNLIYLREQLNRAE